MSLKEHLAEYRAGWYKGVSAERQAITLRTGVLPGRPGGCTAHTDAVIT